MFDSELIKHRLNKKHLVRLSVPSCKEQAAGILLVFSTTLAPCDLYISSKVSLNDCSEV